MGAVAAAVVEPVVKAVESVGQAVESAGREVGKAVEKVGQEVGKGAETVGKTIAENPATAIAIVAAAVAAPALAGALASASLGAGASAAAISAAAATVPIQVATGAILGTAVGAVSTIDTAKNVLEAAAAGGIGGAIGGAVAPAVSSSLPSSVPASVSSGIGSTVGGASQGAAQAALTGQDIGTGALTGAVSGAVGSGAYQAAGGGATGNILGQLVGGTAGGLAAGQTGQQALAGGLFGAINSALSSAANQIARAGQTPTAEQVAAMSDTDINTAQNFIDSVEQTVASTDLDVGQVLQAFAEAGDVDFSKGVRVASNRGTSDIPNIVIFGDELQPIDVEVTASRAPQTYEPFTPNLAQVIFGGAQQAGGVGNAAATTQPSLPTQGLDAGTREILDAAGIPYEDIEPVDVEVTATRQDSEKPFVPEQNLLAVAEPVDVEVSATRIGGGTAKEGAPVGVEPETEPESDAETTTRAKTPEKVGVYTGGKGYFPYQSGGAIQRPSRSSMGMTPTVGSQALAQALNVIPGVAGGGGDVDPSRTGGKKQNVWNVESLKLKDALGA